LLLDIDNVITGQPSTVFASLVIACGQYKPVVSTDSSKNRRLNHLLRVCGLIGPLDNRYERGSISRSV
jgi:hypothetical protein